MTFEQFLTWLSGHLSPKALNQQLGNCSEKPGVSRAADAVACRQVAWPEVKSLFLKKSLCFYRNLKLFSCFVPHCETQPDNPMICVRSGKLRACDPIKVLYPFKEPFEFLSGTDDTEAP